MSRLGCPKSSGHKQRDDCQPEGEQNPVVASAHKGIKHHHRSARCRDITLVQFRCNGPQRLARPDLHRLDRASLRPAHVAVGTRVSPRAPRPDPYVQLSRIRLLPWVCDGTSCRIRSSAFDTRAWLRVQYVLCWHVMWQRVSGGVQPISA